MTRSGDAKVLFVTDEENVATRYRHEHQAEQLAMQGVQSDLIHSPELTPAEDLDGYAAVVLVRVEWSSGVASFVERVRGCGCALLFDTDDLLFEPSLVDRLSFLEHWSADDRRPEVERRARYLQTLEQCDGANVSTDPLAVYAGRHVAHVTVTYNAVSREMIRRADEVVSSRTEKLRKAARRGVTIAYFSGTNTHNHDFLEAADAVLWALEEYRAARLLVVGKLDLDQRFARFRSRVTRLPLQAWRELPKVIARADINLAPLERDNPITECKSCVKYLEAGLLGVPTIASRRPDFARAVAEGETGMLVDTPDEWKSALARLVESGALRNAMGEAARDDVRRKHATAARPAMLHRTLRDIATPAEGVTRD